MEITENKEEEDKGFESFDLLQDHEYIEAIPLPLNTLSLSITSARRTHAQKPQNVQKWK